MFLVRVRACVMARVCVSLFAIAFSFISQASYSKGNLLKFCHFVVPCNTAAVSVLPVTTVLLHYVVLAQIAQLVA